jgi:hypothetical protein
MITSDHAATFPPYERRSFPPGAEVGALAALGPAMVRAAARLVTQGRVYTSTRAVSWACPCGRAIRP